MEPGILVQMKHRMDLWDPMNHRILVEIELMGRGFIRFHAREITIVQDRNVVKCRY